MNKIITDKKVFSLFFIGALTLTLTVGCRAQQTQTAAEKKEVTIAAPTATPISKSSPDDQTSAKINSDSDSKVAKSGDLNYLRKWVGKYTYGSTGKKGKSFFALPEIKTPLLKLLGTENYRKMLAGFARPLPAEEQNNYLILEGVSAELKRVLTHTLLTVDLKSGGLSVAFVTQKSGESVFESYGGFDELPADTQKRIKDYIYPKAN